MGDTKESRSINKANAKLVFILKNAMFGGSHAPKHGSVANQRDARQNRFGRRTVRAFGSQIVKDRRVGLLKRVRSQTVQADNDHMGYWGNSRRRSRRGGYRGGSVKGSRAVGGSRSECGRWGSGQGNGRRRGKRCGRGNRRNSRRATTKDE